MPVGTSGVSPPAVPTKPNRSVVAPAKMPPPHCASRTPPCAARQGKANVTAKRHENPEVAGRPQHDALPPRASGPREIGVRRQEAGETGRIGPDALLRRGAAMPVIHEAIPMGEVVRAHRLVESNETFGKVVLSW